MCRVSKDQELLLSKSKKCDVAGCALKDHLQTVHVTVSDMHMLLFIPALLYTSL